MYTNKYKYITSFIIFPHGSFSKTTWYNATIKYQCIKINNITF